MWDSAIFGLAETNISTNLSANLVVTSLYCVCIHVILNSTRKKKKTYQQGCPQNIRKPQWVFRRHWMSPLSPGSLCCCGLLMGGCVCVHSHAAWTSSMLSSTTTQRLTNIWWRTWAAWTGWGANSETRTWRSGAAWISTSQSTQKHWKRKAETHESVKLLPPSEQQKAVFPCLSWEIRSTITCDRWNLPKRITDVLRLYNSSLHTIHFS